MRTTAVVVLVASGLLAGCEAGMPGGMVTKAVAEPGWEMGPAVGLTAPDVQFLGADGQRHSLNTASGWVSIIGFVETKGQECCMLSPVLAEAASRYSDKPVRVVQVALPTAKCPHGPGCVEACHVRPLHLMALCDSDRIAYNMFGKPKDQTLLLIDGKGKVVQVTTLARIAGIFPQADALATEAEKESLPTYLQIY